MSNIPRARLTRAALAAAVLLCVAHAGPALAQAESGQIETDAEFISFNPADNTITVKVRRTGRRPSDKSLAIRQGRPVVFYVVPTGSVLQRTTVKNQDGTAGTFEDLEAGRRVRVFWIVEDGVRKARSVSVFIPAEEVGEDAEGGS